MKLTKREKTLLFILIVLLVGVVYYKFIYGWQMNVKKSLDDRIQQSRTQLEKVKSLSKNLDKIKNQNTIDQNDVDQLNASLNQTLRIPDEIGELQKAADAEKLTLKSYNFVSKSIAIKGMPAAEANSGAAQVSEAPGTKRLDIIVEISGSYDGCKNFVKYFESNTTRFFAVNDFRYTGDNQSGTATMTLSTLTIGTGE